MPNEIEANQWSDAVQSNCLQEVQWAHRELPKTTGKLQWTHWKLY